MGLFAEKGKVIKADPRCKDVCKAAADIPGIAKGGGTVICLDGGKVKCICQFNFPFPGGSIKPGECPSFDACIQRHEQAHIDDGLGLCDPRNPTPHPMRFPDTERQKKSECRHRLDDISCLQSVKGDSNPKCTQAADALIGMQETYVKAHNCHEVLRDVRICTCVSNNTYGVPTVCRGGHK